MSDETALTIAGIGVALAVPVTFMFANWVRKNVEHGEAQFKTPPEGRISEDRDQE